MTTSSMTKEQRAELAKALRQLDRLSIDYLTCRLFGHAWFPIPPDREPLFGRLIVLECSRCHSKRDDIFDVAWGKVLVRTYRYAEGYQLQRNKDHVAISRDAVRKLWDQRVNG